MYFFSWSPAHFPACVCVRLRERDAWLNSCLFVLEDNDTLGTLANDLRCCDESVLLSDFIIIFFFKKCPQLSSCFCWPSLFCFFCFVYFETDLFQRIYLNYLKFINKEMIKHLFSLCALELHLLCMWRTAALTVINNSRFLCCRLSNSTGCSLSHRLLNTANFCKIFLLGCVRLYLGEKKKSYIFNKEIRVHIYLCND